MSLRHIPRYRNDMGELQGSKMRACVSLVLDEYYLRAKRQSIGLVRGYVDIELCLKSEYYCLQSGLVHKRQHFGSKPGHQTRKERCIHSLIKDVRYATKPYFYVVPSPKDLISILSCTSLEV